MTDPTPGAVPEPRHGAAATALAMARSALFGVLLAVTVVPWALAVVFASLFTRGPVIYRMCVGWLTLSIAFARVVCGVRARLHGFDRLPTTPVVLLSKHQSTWETFAYPGLMPRPLAYVFKRELLRVPFFGWAMARLDMIHIDRRRRAEAWNLVAEQGRTLMDMGLWVIMFPEGTRAARGGQEPYKAGGARLAVQTGRPVVPLAVASARCWPRRSWILRPGIVDVSVGPLLPSLGRRPDELMREVEAWIEAEMRRLDPLAYPGAAVAADADARAAADAGRAGRGDDTAPPA